MSGTPGTRDALEPPTPTPGAVVDGRYVVEARIGAGATGVVLRVRHHDTGRRLALKLLTAPMDDAERFRREARALGAMDHANIVAVTDSGLAPEFGRRPYLVTEYLEGRSLREWLSRPLDRQLALEWLAAIADAVDHAHEHGVLHRDLKPENVIVCEAPGRTPTPKVVDFGLARWRDGTGARPRPDGSPHLTDADQLVGTPAYVSPEQIRGEAVGPPADVYALGVMAYEMLGGGLPFTGTVTNVLDDHLARAAPPPADVPDELSAVLLRALAKNPADRPATACAFVSALREADQRVRRRAHADAFRPRRRRLAVAAAIVSVASTWWLSRAGWVETLEQRSLDWRFGLLSPRPPDGRLLLVTIDERSLAADPRPLTEWSDDIGAFASRALRGGALGVAIDLVLPKQAGEAAAWAELLASHAAQVVLAATADEDGHVTGPELVDAATREVLGEGRVRQLFGLVNVRPDSDGVHRQARSDFHVVAGGTLASWAARAAGLLQPEVRTSGPDDALVLLQGDLQRGAFQRVPWHEAVRAAGERFRGRLVLLGAEFAGSGDSGYVVALSGRKATISGLELQALLLASRLSDHPVRAVRGRELLAFLGVAAALVVGAGIARDRERQGVAILVVLAVVYTVAAVLAFTVLSRALPLLAPLASLVAAMAIAWAAAALSRSWSLT